MAFLTRDDRLNVGTMTETRPALSSLTCSVDCMKISLFYRSGEVTLPRKRFGSRLQKSLHAPGHHGGDALPQPVERRPVGWHEVAPLGHEQICFVISLARMVAEIAPRLGSAVEMDDAGVPAHGLDLVSGQRHGRRLAKKRPDHVPFVVEPLP